MIGWCELIFGSMYCGKSEELIRRLRRCEFAGQESILFKPIIDNRYDLSKVFTHESNKVKKFIIKTLSDTKYDINEGSILRSIIDNIPGSMDAINISKPSEILQHHNLKNYDVIGIDEVQFFDKDLIPVIEELIKQGKRVIVSGLDMYTSGTPFPIVADLACISKHVNKLHAVCVDCGEEAMYSFRLDSDNTTSVVEIGSVGKYIAVCPICRNNRLNADLKEGKEND